MNKSEKDWIEEYTKRGALWVHDGNPKRPHVRLHKGGHSDIFFNSEGIMEHSLLLDLACQDLVELLVQKQTPLPNWTKEESSYKIVGPAMGAITLADGIARNLERAHKLPCKRAYTVKNAEGRQFFDRCAIESDDVIIPIEDVITTGDSVTQTISLCEEDGAYVMPCILALVNRSGLEKVGDRKIIALIDLPGNNYEASTCPLCAEGSEALYPAKSKENWPRLTATY